MTREEWIKIYNAKDGTWDKDDLIDKAYEIITSPIKTNYDRIKSMSVEEMADILKDIYTQGYVDCLHDEGNVSRYEIEQWLLQEVSENDR
jgi:hypothetical protein